MDRKTWPCWLLVVVLAVALIGVWRSLTVAQAELDRLREEVSGLKEKIAQLEKECGEPLPGPIIDITPNPNGDGNHFTIGGAPAIPTPPQGDTLNRWGFGKVTRFRAVFNVDGTTVTRDLASFTAKFGGKLLEVKRIGSNPETFQWTFGEKVLGSWPNPPSQRHWRDDLCTSMTDVQWTFKIPENLTGTLVKVEIQADVAQQ